MLEVEKLIERCGVRRAACGAVEDVFEMRLSNDVDNGYRRVGDIVMKTYTGG